MMSLLNPADSAQIPVPAPDAKGPDPGLALVVAALKADSQAQAQTPQAQSQADLPPPQPSPDKSPRRSHRPGQEFIFDEGLARRLVRWLGPVLKFYFRAEVRGVENFPAEQTMVVANHDGGMLPLDGLILGAAWHRHFDFSRPLAVMVHDMVMRLVPAINRIGGVLADRPQLDAVLDAGHSVMIYPGGSRETFRSFFERKQVTLGNRTGFIKHALNRRLPITPVVSVGGHETLFVLWRGGWLAERLGITRRFRADVFPIVAGLPFGIWLGALMPHLPLPAKITVQVLRPINIVAAAEQFLGRPFSDDDLDDPAVLHACFRVVQTTMQDALTGLYAERKLPIIG